MFQPQKPKPQYEARLIHESYVGKLQVAPNSSLDKSWFLVNTGSLGIPRHAFLTLVQLDPNAELVSKTQSLDVRGV